MSRAAATCLAAALLAPTAAAATAGETWEQTTEFQMKSVAFPIPPQTTTVCRAKGAAWDEPPPQRDDEDCKATVLKKTSSSLRWKLVCPKQRMDGEGEMTWGPTTYSGKMAMRSPQGDVAVKFTGKKIGAPCDPEEQAREADDRLREIEAQQASAGAMICQGAVESMSASHFTGNPPLCADRTKRDELCERARTREGLQMLRDRGEAEVAVAVRLCKLDLVKVEAGFCDAALAEEDLDYVGDRCPAQTKVVAKRECAGRTYTDVRSSYRDFCARFAAEEMSREGPAALPARRDGATDAGKKILKGLFGR